LTTHPTSPVDNIYVGDSPEDAKKFAKETFHVKYAIEKEEEGSLDEDEDESKLGLTDQLRLKAYQFASELGAARRHLPV
jgi:calnexin